VTVSVVGFVAYALVAVLRAPTGFGQLADGLVHGPSELLTFALPLVSPRTLLIDPVALTWLAGTVAGIGVTRRWRSTLPCLGLLTAFGLGYAATQRAAGSDALLLETSLGAGLLGCLLALRAIQSWRGGTMRALSVPAIAAVGVTVVAALLVQSAAFPKRASEPQRAPTVNDTNPLTPVAFVAGLRPSTSSSPDPVLFRLRTSAPTTGYISLANVDYYDGAGWSFDRTFRPSGGVVPADVDRNGRGGALVSQSYRIMSGPLAGNPWMPYIGRPQRVTNVSINIDAPSGMIVPTRRLSGGADYSVRSTAPGTTFERLDAGRISPDASTPAADVQLPATLRSTLATIVTALSAETGVPSSDPVVFLQALQRDFRSHYALVAPAPSGSRLSQRAGGTGFADVLASILGSQRTATPEQYATLTALLARYLSIPARVVTGFRIPVPSGSDAVAAGDYDVRAAQAWTWTEIAVTGVGWVVLDPSPTTFRTPAGDQTSGGAATPTPTAQPTQNVLVTTGNGGHAVSGKSAVPHTRLEHGQFVLVLILVAAGLVLLAALGTVLSRKRLRARRRRHRGSARERVAAAWEETIDQLYEAGLAPPGQLDALTSEEISARTRDRFDSLADLASSIGTAAESAAFHTAVAVRDDDAEEIWRAQLQVRRGLARRLTWRQRIAMVARYHRPSRTPRLRRSH